MNVIKTALIMSIPLMIAACNTTKKSTSSAVTAPAPASTPTPASDSYLFTKGASGTPAPGDDALTAIRAQYKDVTMETLKLGHTIYTTGACVNCHGAKEIYPFSEADWKIIIDDMVQRTTLTAAEKDAVYKYVLAIKATQPK